MKNVRLTTHGNRLLMIPIDKIVAIAETTPRPQENGIMSEVWTIGSEDWFSVKETPDTIEARIKEVETP